MFSEMTTLNDQESSLTDQQDPKDLLIFRLMTENVQLSEQKAELERRNAHLEQAYDHLFEELMGMMNGLHRFHRGVMEALSRYWTVRSLKRRLRELADTHLKATPQGGAH